MSRKNERRSRMNEESQPKQGFPQQRKKVEITHLTQTQRDYSRLIYENHIVIAIGPAGTGKAQPLDAKIHTPNGWTRMGDMKVGSQITAHDGSVQTVTGVFPQGEKPIYRITFEDGRSTECCDEHLWEIHYYEWDAPRVVSTAELRQLLSLKSKKNRLYVRLFTPSNTHKAAELSIDPYVLGCLIGDGSMKTDIRLSSADQELIDTFHYKLGSSYNMIKINDTYDYRITCVDQLKEQGTKDVYRHPLKIALDDLGLMGKGSHEKFIPKKYLEDSNLFQKIELLCGLMDTDGTVCDSMSYSTTSHQLALDVQYLVRSIGGLCKIAEKKTSYTYNGSKKSGRLAYNLSIRLKNPSIAFCLTRKKDKVLFENQYTNRLKLRVKSIDFVGNKEAQCIMVDHPDHLYVTDDYIVTHNTHLAALHAMKEFTEGRVAKIILCRPAVEAGGEKIGYLPGNLNEKMNPYLLPVFDAFETYWSPRTIKDMIDNGQIEILPLGFARGRTFHNAFVILDEAQNATPDQLLMLLTRIGEGSTIVVTGDPQQKDTYNSCLGHASRKLQGIRGIGFVAFPRSEIVRHPIVEAILNAWDDVKPEAFLTEETSGDLPDFITQ